MKPLKLNSLETDKTHKLNALTKWESASSSNCYSITALEKKNYSFNFFNQMYKTINLLSSLSALKLNKKLILTLTLRQWLT